MTGIQMKRRASLFAVIAVAAMIFVFSAQEGEDSSRLSQGVTEWVLGAVVPGYGAMSLPQKLRYLKLAGFWVRKAAHFSEYALLGATLLIHLRYAMAGRRYRAMALWSWLIATLYACTDELHQMFVGGRGPAIRDVLIDSAGALAGAWVGVAAILLWHSVRRRRAESREDNDGR